MKRLYVLLFFILFTSAGIIAQTYENSWINYSQPYYKIKVWQEGIYRINTNTLLFAGIPATVINHHNFQLFHNGQEQYIYIYDQNNNDTLNQNSDYIEFYGQRNDGTLDSKMYQDPTWQPNSNYSLFTDTSIYYLTYNTSLANKRITSVTDTSFSSNLNIATYFIKESYKEETGYYNAGTTYNGETDIDYTEAEGWMDVPYGVGAPAVKTLNTQNVYVNGPNIEIATAIAGANSLAHNISINFPGTNFSDSYSGYTLKRYNFSVSPALFSSATTTFTYSSVVPGSLDPNCFINLSVKYPHTYNLENASSFKLYVPDDPNQGKTNMNITNFNLNGSSEIILYDLSNHKRYTVTQTGSALQALVANDGQSNPKTCYLTSGSQIINIGSLSTFTYASTSTPGIFNNFLNAAKDSAYIIITNHALWSDATSYKTYRNLTTNNKVLLIDIDELYDQFAYGIQKHPLAIRNFAKYILDNWTGVHPPQQIFLIGKSIAARLSRTDPQSFASNLVPSFGNPPSDILLTSHINGSLYDPKIQIGRLSAQTGTQEVTYYLQKVQEYEAAQNGSPQAWMKEVLHFSGGDNAVQQAQIAGYLNAFKTIIEDTLYGGHVTTYYKTSSAPIVIDQSAGLQTQIDTGVSLMTFYGHASGSGFDESTDIPENYANQGRYPVVLANSCFAGDIHTSMPSISERFVTLPEKGSVAFIASVSEGDQYYLDYYSDSLYNNISWRFYGQPIGKLMQQTILQVQDSNSFGLKNACLEMTLEGDPILKFNNWRKPDLMMSPSNVFFTPNSITADLDTFNIHVIVRNIAKAARDSFNVVITRTYPNGTDSVYTVRIANCFYADTLAFTMHVNGFNSVGINTFRVDVDLPANTVPEIDDFGNNTTTATLFITSHDLIPVYPPQFAIVPYSTTALKANTSDPLIGMRTYRFEMDTSYQAFGNPPQPSPMFRFATISDSGGVVTWNNNIPLGDSVVYYWRVANDSVRINPAKYKWQESSFIHIAAKTGWSQKHFYQYENDVYTNVQFDSTNRRFNFVPNIKTLNALTYGSPTGAGLNDCGYTLNNVVEDYNGCGLAVMVAVMDSITLEPWTTCSYNFGQANQFVLTGGDCNNPTGYNVTPPCGSRNRPEKFFMFRYTAASLDSMANMLNHVPNGDYILIYSMFTTSYSATPTFASNLLSVGITHVALLPDNVPYVFFIKKGVSTSQFQTIGATNTDTVRLTTLLSTVWDRGNIVTNLIGPSSHWSELHWREHKLETGTSKDIALLSIYGVRANNQIDTLVAAMTTSMLDTSLSWISAAQYPYLKLGIYLQDDSLRTPPQLDKWQVYYDELPECSINANDHFSFHSNPLAEGDTIRMSVAIDNIGNKPMDSLAVDFYMYDNNRIRHNVKSLKLDSLRVGHSLLANVEIDSTFGFAGSNSLWVEANPLDARHQPEQVHFNNLAQMKFNITHDVINPILDVTFDAIHILDGDIISGKPDIAIQLHDENKFLALNDTSDFRVYLMSPSSSSEQRVYFSQPMFGNAMRFTPAVLPKNSCRIDWNPVFTQDGTYILEVEATDKSKNESGKYNYRISFEVINKSTITEVLNYPNPFSTSTRFVFTLTGNEIPTNMKIQIMTVTGKIVREIFQNELGNIHIGRNITDYAWNGKDQYGDQLANGVYLYRVITNLHGSSVELRETEVDHFFKKGWGKMYLMR